MTSVATLGSDSTTGFGPALRIFKRAARHVPAYRDFLAIHGLDPTTIRTPADFARVPVITKESYLDRYPLDMLMWDGEPTLTTLWSTSSGSSGRPTYWPRSLGSIEQNADLHARLFRRCFDSHHRSTLVIVAFALGNWIAATFTEMGASTIARRGFPLSVITPGLDADATIDNLERLAPHYEQVVLAGYPPVVKDLLDRIPSELLDRKVKLLVSGDGISEAWRDYALDKVGSPENPESVCLVYGSSDVGMIGHETPTTIHIRRESRANAAIGEALFGTTKSQPVLVEYDPNYRYAEVDTNGYLMYTADSSVPLIRYRMSDQGILYTPHEMSERLREHGSTEPIYMSNEGCGFLALRGRTDVATTFLAFPIYPESIKPALEGAHLSAELSGRFVLESQTSDTFAQTLHLRVELRAGREDRPGLLDDVRREVVESLDRTNPEYLQCHQKLGRRVEPHVTLHRFHSDGFQHNRKHRWNGAVR